MTRGPLFAAALVGLATIIGVIAGATHARYATTQSLVWGEKPAPGRWSPCFAHEGEAKMTLAFTRWRDEMLAKDPSFEMPDIMLVPTGLNAGQWILPGCVAIEEVDGSVTFWRDRKGGPARWVPFPQASTVDETR